MINISARPAEVADSAELGQWERDVTMGKNGRSAIAALAERRSRFVVLVRLGDIHTAEHVCAALTHRVQAVPELLFRSLSWDHVEEMAVDTLADVFVYDASCTPHRITAQNRATLDF